MQNKEELLGFVGGLDSDGGFANPFFEGFQFISAEGLGVVNGLAKEEAPLLEKALDHGVMGEGVLEAFVEGVEDFLGAQFLHGKVAVEVMGCKGDPRARTGEPL
jgi:hypothetical protein